MKIRIRRRIYENGKVTWQLDAGRVNGKRYQRAFPSQRAAEAAARDLVAEKERGGQAAAAMPAAQRVRYAAAELQLRSAGVALEQAVAWALERASQAVKRPLGDLVREFLEIRAREGKRPRYLKQLAVSVRSFVRGRQDQTPNDIEKRHVEQWLFGNDWSPKTQKGYLGDLSNFFRWAVGKNGRNPCEGVRPARAEQKEIAVLSPEQIEQLFRAAVFATGRRFDRHSQSYDTAHVFRPLIAYLALATFCGIRPEEIQRSGSRALDLDQAVFVVAGNIAKTGRRRVVDVPPAALAWLELWRKFCGPSAPIVPRNFRKLWENLREHAQLKPPGWRADPKIRAASQVAAWPQDALRHTAATMHYAAHQNAALLKAQLGHVEHEQTLFSNYRAIRLLDGRAVSKGLAAIFWAIVPAAEMIEAAGQAER